MDGPPDPDLDADLRDWYADDPGRPRIGVLGPVLVNAPGVAPESRRRLHAELVVFLAQRGARGADAVQLASALWPDTRVTDAALQRIISRARTWLGTTRTGEPWLCDVDESLTYRLADGYLFDWHLFRRLRTRAETKGALGEPDLRAALELVRGRRWTGADRPRRHRDRNPYPWLAESEIHQRTWSPPSSTPPTISRSCVWPAATWTVCGGRYGKRGTSTGSAATTTRGGICSGRSTPRGTSPKYDACSPT